MGRNKQVQCNVCNKDIRSDNLARHMRVHGGDIKSRDERNSLNYQKLSNKRDQNKSFGKKDDMKSLADHDIEDSEKSYDSERSHSVMEEFFNEESITERFEDIVSKIAKCTQELIIYRGKYIELLKEIRELPKSKETKSIIKNTIKEYAYNLKRMQGLWVSHNIQDEEGIEQMDNEYDSELESNNSEDFEDSNTDSEPLPKRRKMSIKNLEHESENDSESETDSDSETDSEPLPKRRKMLIKNFEPESENGSESETDSSDIEDGDEIESDLDNEEENEIESESLENEDDMENTLRSGYDAYHKGFHRFYTMFEDVIYEKGKWAKKTLMKKKNMWNMDSDCNDERYRLLHNEKLQNMAKMKVLGSNYRLEKTISILENTVERIDALNCKEFFRGRCSEHGIRLISFCCDQVLKTEPEKSFKDFENEIIDICDSKVSIKRKRSHLSDAKVWNIISSVISEKVLPAFRNLLEQHG